MLKTKKKENKQNLTIGNFYWRKIIMNNYFYFYTFLLAHMQKRILHKKTNKKKLTYNLSE